MRPAALTLEEAFLVRTVYANRDSYLQWRIDGECHSRGSCQSRTDELGRPDKPAYSPACG